MVMCFLVLFFVVSAFFPTNAFLSNDIADKLLSDLNNVMSTKKLDYLTIPGFSKELDIPVNGTKGKIRIACHSGSVGSFSTMQRTGNVISTNRGKRVSKFDIEIPTLNFRFKKCNMKGLKHCINTAVEGTVGHNLATIRISHKKNQDKCIVSVDGLTLYKMGPISVDTGEEFFISILNRISNWVKDLLKVIVRGRMQVKLENVIKRIIPEVDLCKHVPGGFV